MERRIFVYKSPIGDIYCLFEGTALIESSIKEAKGKRQKAKGKKHTATYSPSPITSRLFNELDAYFKGKLKKFNQKIKFVSGTDFERKAWLALREIPYGETRPYKWLAERIGSPKAMRAVGRALKKNPLPIVLPCHRVIASDGSIGGFSCGIEIKRWLLRHENRHGKVNAY
jgi:methylated-DNA-[protein]-cysteine S-methyltransferase